MLQAGPPSFRYYCAVVLHSCILLPHVGHSSNHQYHCCQLTKQSSCVSNFYRTFQVFIWLSLLFVCVLALRTNRNYLPVQNKLGGLSDLNYTCSLRGITETLYTTWKRSSLSIPLLLAATCLQVHITVSRRKNVQIMVTVWRSSIIPILKIRSVFRSLKEISSNQVLNFYEARVHERVQTKSETTPWDSASLMVVNNMKPLWQEGSNMTDSV